MRWAIQPQKERSTSTAESAPFIWAEKLVSRCTSSTPSNGTSVSTATSATTVAMMPASPKVRINSELANSREKKDRPAVACVSTQAGPAMRMASRKASYLLWPAINRSRARYVSCMLSEKLITMISGVITLRKMLRRKSSQPSTPSASRMAVSGGAAANTHDHIHGEDTLAEKTPAHKTTA